MSETLEPLVTPTVLPSGVNRYTAEDIAKMNTALEACNGDVTSAAKLIGLPSKTVIDQIEKRPEMKARWRPSHATIDGQVDQVGVTAEIERTSPRELALSDTEKRAAALIVHERKMKRSLALIGFKPQEIELINSVEQFAGQHFKQTLSIMHGALVKVAIRLMLQAQEIEEKYLCDDTLDDKNRKFFWDIYFSIIEKIRLMNAEANKAALTKAMIELKKDGAQQSKPGFSVPQVAIQINGANNIAAGKSGQPDPTP